MSIISSAVSEPVANVPVPQASGITASQSETTKPATKKPKLYLGTLFVDRGAIPGYYYSLARSVSADLFDITLSHTGHGDGAPRQFNRRVEEFLNHTDCDYFWLQGNDTDWDPVYIHHMATSGFKIVGGMVPIKQRELRWGYQALADGPRAVDLDTGFVEVRSVILECVLIHRDVLIARQKSRPDLDYSGNHGNAAPYKLHHHWRWELVGQAPDGVPKDDEWQHRMLQSEDYFFCDEARKLGFKVMLDASGYCGHWDSRVRFPLTPPEPAANLNKPYGYGQDEAQKTNAG